MPDSCNNVKLICHLFHNIRKGFSPSGQAMVQKFDSHKETVEKIGKC
jgi:hypothetical protein